MTGGLRRALRGKLERVVRQAVEESTVAQRQDELLRRHEYLVQRFDDVEHRIRRDIDYAGQIVSAHEASAFVLQHMPNARRFSHPHDTLRYGLGLARPEGLTLEFGVAAGHTLRVIAATRPAGTVFGFDSYQGFPEDWRTDFPRGMFAMEKPDVPGAQIVEGWFEDTLPPFLAAHDEPIAFVHADGDLYSSTKTILDNVRDRLTPGTIIQFDEFFNYPGWRDHEYRAWEEFVSEAGVRFTYEAYSADHEQVVVRISD